METETEQVKTILRNMKEYSLKNSGDFTSYNIKACDLLANQPKDLINYSFYDYGLILNFNVSFDKQIVYIEEFSENADTKQEMTFKEFIKFQNHFLKNGA